MKLLKSIDWLLILFLIVLAIIASVIISEWNSIVDFCHDII